MKEEMKVPLNYNPTNPCGRCGHSRMVHEPHCVVTYYAAKQVCPDNCREFVEETD